MVRNPNDFCTLWNIVLHPSSLIHFCTYQCHAPLPPMASTGESGARWGLDFQSRQHMEQTLKIPMQTEVGDYWGVDAYSVSMQNTDNIVISNPQQ